jgi:hypothetical protein
VSGSSDDSSGPPAAASAADLSSCRRNMQGNGGLGKGGDRTAVIDSSSTRLQGPFLANSGKQTHSRAANRRTQMQPAP